MMISINMTHMAITMTIAAIITGATISINMTTSIIMMTIRMVAMATSTTFIVI